VNKSLSFKKCTVNVSLFSIKLQHLRLLMLDSFQYREFLSFQWFLVNDSSNFYQYHKNVSKKIAIHYLVFIKKNWDHKIYKDQIHIKWHQMHVQMLSCPASLFIVRISLCYACVKVQWLHLKKMEIILKTKSSLKDRFYMFNYKYICNESNTQVTVQPKDWLTFRFIYIFILL
jgi:hypothetical protein